LIIEVILMGNYSNFFLTFEASGVVSLNLFTFDDVALEQFFSVITPIQLKI